MMINLLPTRQKKELLDQRQLKLVLILGILSLSFLLSLFLILSLVKNYIASDLETKKIILKERERIISLNESLKKEIEEANDFFSNLNSFYQNNVNLTRATEKISEILTSGIYLTNFSFNFAKEKTGERPQISLSGHCPNRNLLLELKKNLEENFSEVYFSPASWVKATEIKFSVSFKLN